MALFLFTKNHYLALYINYKWGFINIKCVNLTNNSKYIEILK